MGTLARFLAGAVIAYGLNFLLQYVEQLVENPIQPVVLSVTATALATGFVVGSAATAALAVLVGAVASFFSAYFLGFFLWSPSPIPSDLPTIRLLIIGGTALLTAGFGYVSGRMFAAKPKPEEVSLQVTEQFAQPAEVEETTKKTSATVPVQMEQAMKVCKFCQNVIPSESIFCPMCGAKLVEPVE
ncbi:MAG: hypothetical protein QXY84_03010 [Candidatus Caldarchaeum sp.]|uniref:Zinc ribbon domain-containing protein n=1 Tax=Caldiarchaeum subterraneum TaxID=311458 RepID=A0A7C5U4C8_CALS0